MVENVWEAANDSGEKIQQEKENLYISLMKDFAQEGVEKGGSFKDDLEEIMTFSLSTPDTSILEKIKAFAWTKDKYTWLEISEDKINMYTVKRNLASAYAEEKKKPTSSLETTFPWALTIPRIIVPIIIHGLIANAGDVIK